MQIRQQSFSRNKRITYACFLAPALLLYMGVVIIPFLQGIPYSFTNWNLLSNASNFVGFKNYQTLFKSKEFWTIVRNTFQFTAYYVTLSNVIGLFVALMLHKSSRLNNLCRTVIFMPYVISLVTGAFVWRYIYSAILSPMLGIVSPLGMKATAMFAISVISIWRTSGYCMLIYIAGLQGIPGEYYEAASVEGANGVQQFFRITLPMLVPAVASNISLLMAWGLKVFEVVRATTNGGPTRNATTTMSMYIYNMIFANSKAGYGQAVAIVMTLILLVVSFLVSKFFNSKEVA